MTGAHFDATTARWTIDTTDGSRLIARHTVLASGPLHVPAIPTIKGMEKFKGKVFHSAQWDHGYDLKGRTVVSIGTGGSAIQYCPEIAPDVKQLYVFQRTPAWVIPRDTRAYPEIEKKLYAAVQAMRKLHRLRLYWTNESRVWPIFNPAIARTLQNLAKVIIRLRVKDSALAKKLTPDYTIGCKRALISNKWYPMFNRDNVELGTGFIVDPRIYMKHFPCIGLPGHDLNVDWKDGAEAYYGVNVTGFPNMYQLVGPNTALGHNSIIFMIECQVYLILEQLRLMKEKGADYVEAKPAAQMAFNQHVQENIKGTVWRSGCQSWYQQDGGKNFTIWPFSTWKYWLETRKLKIADYTFGMAAKQPKAGARKAATLTVV